MNARRPSARRSSFELIADAVSAGSARVSAEDPGARRRDAPDPTLTAEERAALEEATESARGDLIKAKPIGPDLGSAQGKWAAGARAPDGRIFFAPLMARAVHQAETLRETSIVRSTYIEHDLLHFSDEHPW